MNEQQQMVLEFHKVFAARVPQSPELGGYPGEFRVALLQEEVEEFAEAVRANDLIEMIDALCDILYVTYGAAVEAGVDLEPFFAEVHRSNMAKRGGALRADGKMLKPAGWMPPDLRRVFRETYGEDTLIEYECETG
jgi:predicted HAD superfamily Cof-like phosphohydrolase